MARSVAVLLCLLAGASAFSPVRPMRRTTTTMQAAATEKVVMDTLPNIYVYDHCPFCVRVRLGLGYKGIKHNLIFMGNDDIPTPTALVGKKIAPILEMKDDGTVMPESLDIIKFFDEDPKYGPVNAIKPATDRKDIKAWQKGLQTTLRMLTRPRYMETALPEFMQQDGKDAFVKNHQLPPFEKAEWKGDGAMSMDEKWKLYKEALGKTEEHLPALNAALKELDGMICCEDCCSEGGFSYDDIDLWSRLRSISLVKGAEFPPKLKAYMDKYAEIGDVPLYWNMQV